MQSRKSFGPKGLNIYSSLYISSVELKFTLWNHFGEVFKVMESLFFPLTPRKILVKGPKTVMLKFVFVLCFGLLLLFFFFFKHSTFFK